MLLFIIAPIVVEGNLRITTRPQWKPLILQGLCGEPRPVLNAICACGAVHVALNISNILEKGRDASAGTEVRFRMSGRLPQSTDPINSLLDVWVIDSVVLRSGPCVRRRVIM